MYPPGDLNVSKHCVILTLIEWEQKNTVSLFEKTTFTLIFNRLFNLEVDYGQILACFGG